MKTLPIVVLLCVTLPSCGQSVKSDKQPASDKEIKIVYQEMTHAICNCTLKTMKNNRPSTTGDSCYKDVVDKYADTLRSIGYDPALPFGRNKLMNGLQFILCKDLMALMEKEWAQENAKKLLFKGTIVSQKRLPTGDIEIVMEEIDTRKKMVFKHKSFLSDPLASNQKTLSYEMTIEYEIRPNPKTGQDEFYIKENGTLTTLAVEKKDN